MRRPEAGTSGDVSRESLHGFLRCRALLLMGWKSRVDLIGSSVDRDEERRRLNRHMQLRTSRQPESPKTFVMKRVIAPSIPNGDRMAQYTPRCSGAERPIMAKPLESV